MSHSHGPGTGDEESLVVFPFERDRILIRTEVTASVLVSRNDSDNPLFLRVEYSHIYVIRPRDISTSLSVQKEIEKERETCLLPHLMTNICPSPPDITAS